MNEKIKELAKQANIHFSRVGILDGDPNGSARLVGYSKMEKFAELIVRECAELFVDQKYMRLNPHEPFANERIRALKDHDMDTVRKIKGHFGVK